MTMPIKVRSIEQQTTYVRQRIKQQQTFDGKLGTVPIVIQIQIQLFQFQ